MGRPPDPDPDARRTRGPDPRRAAIRLASASMVLEGVTYLLGWAGPEPELFRILNALSLVVTVCALGLGRAPLLMWAAIAAVVAAAVGVADLAHLNGAGILAVMCSILAAVTAPCAWFARHGYARWLPPSLFPAVSREPVPTGTPRGTTGWVSAAAPVRGPGPIPLRGDLRAEQEHRPEEERHGRSPYR